MSYNYKIRTDIVTCRPHQVGWLRRPELDLDGSAVWELPDGRLLAFEAYKGEPVIQIIKADDDAIRITKASPIDGGSGS